MFQDYKNTLVNAADQSSSGASFEVLGVADKKLGIRRSSVTGKQLFCFAVGVDSSSDCIITYDFTLETDQSSVENAFLEIGNRNSSSAVTVGDVVQITGAVAIVPFTDISQSIASGSTGKVFYQFKGKVVVPAAGANSNINNYVIVGVNTISSVNGNVNGNVRWHHVDVRAFNPSK